MNMRYFHATGNCHNYCSFLPLTPSRSSNFLRENFTIRQVSNGPIHASMHFPVDSKPGRCLMHISNKQNCHHGFDLEICEIGLNIARPLSGPVWHGPLSKQNPDLNIYKRVEQESGRREGVICPMHTLIYRHDPCFEKD